MANDKPFPSIRRGVAEKPPTEKLPKIQNEKRLINDIVAITPRKKPGRGGPRTKMLGGNVLRQTILDYLAAMDPNEGGHYSRLQMMVKRLYEISQSNGKDAIHAFQALAVFAYGKPSPSEEELEAMSDSGIKVVILPQLREHAPRPPKPVAPIDYIDAEPNDET